MTKKIHQLSETVINKIAAGEVIESPVSVVKELIDNAIDAKSTKIMVEIRKGGFLAIEVDDNGFGMNETDLKNSILRHATSKIDKAEDLFDLTTMGFRGEALSSICAVAKVVISSADKIACGHEMSIIGGKIAYFKSKTRSQGTKISISDIFFNVPARKKFQKSIGSNTAAITKLVQQFSLAHPNVQFQLIADEKLILKLNVYPLEINKQLEKRVKDLFKENFFGELKWVDNKIEQMHVYGFLSYPKFFKKNRLNQYLYINQRCVVSEYISNIIQLAYGTRIPEGNYPVFILFFELPPSEVDFNVHPQKKQVRINNLEIIEKLIFNCVKEAFEKNIPSPKFNLSITQQFDYNFKAPKQEFQKQIEVNLPFEKSDVVNFEYLKIMGRYCFLESDVFSQSLKLDAKKFIVADLKEIYFLIVYINLLNDKKVPIETQSLLVPILIELSKDQITFIQDKVEYFKQVGFEINIGGVDTVFVYRAPTFFSAEDVKELIEQFCIKDQINDLKEKQIMKIAQAMKKIKKQFSEIEAKILLKNLVYAKDPFYSPTGKPTLIQCDDTDIHKLFGSKRAQICHL